MPTAHPILCFQPELIAPSPTTNAWHQPSLSTTHKPTYFISLIIPLLQQQLVVQQLLIRHLCALSTRLRQGRGLVVKVMGELCDTWGVCSSVVGAGSQAQETAAGQQAGRKAEICVLRACSRHTLLQARCFGV